MGPSRGAQAPIGNIGIQTPEPKWQHDTRAHIPWLSPLGHGTVLRTSMLTTRGCKYSGATHIGFEVCQISRLLGPSKDAPRLQHGYAG